MTRYVTRTENSARATNCLSVGTENNIHGRRGSVRVRVSVSVTARARVSAGVTVTDRDRI